MPKLLLKKKHHFTFFGFTCIHKTIIDDFFHLSLCSIMFFLSISTNCPPEKRQSFIISFTFFHCAFSNASSNCLHEKTRSHIGCICLTSLHCAFSNVSSNGLPEKMFDCVISNVTKCDFFSSSKIFDVRF